MKFSKNYHEITPPHSATALHSFAGVMHAAELERMRAIRLIDSGKRAQGLNELLQLSVFSQRWLENADTLISHIVALANVQ